MIFNLMNGMMKTPILDSAYPADMSILNGESATFQVVIAEDGMPAAYTYQWYVDEEAVSGETGASFTYTAPEDSTNYTKSISCAVTNSAGTVHSRGAVLSVKSHIPEFTYDGSYEVVNDSDKASSEADVNWKIRLLTSGKLKFTDLRGAKDGIDVFLVGGGGGGHYGYGDSNTGGGGGGGGYTKTVKNVAVDTNKKYSIVIGAGGGDTADGGKTSAFGASANGGETGPDSYSGGDGGSGGGSGGTGGFSAVVGNTGGKGGSNGGDGASGGQTPGSGQGTTTREFGESGKTVYAGGGGGGGGAAWDVSYQAGGGSGGSGGGGSGGSFDGSSATSGKTNKGGGGGGAARYGSGASGGSGIVIIRNKR